MSCQLLAKVPSAKANFCAFSRRSRQEALFRFRRKVRHAKTVKVKTFSELLSYSILRREESTVHKLCVELFGRSNFDFTPLKFPPEHCYSKIMAVTEYTRLLCSPGLSATQPCAS